MKTPAVLLVLLFVRSFAFPVEDVAETASNKADVNAEIEEKFGDFKENCFPKPSGGCSCNEKDADGNEVVAKYDAEAQCKLPAFNETREGAEEVEETVSNKAAVNAEIEEKFGDFKENCFPKPSGGCSCNEKDADGNEVVAKYDAEAQCKLPVFTETREGVPIFKRSVTEEQARANYDKVVQELKEKFKGLKEGCYPRPKGCLCVVGKNADGRDITERRMKEMDCKCREGEVGSGCPAGA